MLLAEVMTDTYQGSRPHYLVLTNSFEKFHRSEFSTDCDNSHVTLVDLKNFPCVEKKACLLIHILEPFHPGLMIIIISMFS